MSCSCSDPDCKRRFPCEADLEKLKCLYIEYYNRHASPLPVKRLDKEKSRVHPLYQDTRTKDRVYFPEENVPLFGPFDPHTFNQTFFGIDTERSLIFTAAEPILELLEWQFKPGDQICYQGAWHEVLTLKRNPDSFYDQYDYSFEWSIATYIPNRGT